LDVRRSAFNAFTKQGAGVRIAPTRLAGPIIAALAALAVLAGCVRFNKFYNATSDFAEAERLRGQRPPGARITAAETRKYEACIARCQEIVTEHPNSGFVDDCMLLVGKSWLRQGEHGRAERWLQRLVDEYPHGSHAEEASFLLGVTARQDGRPRAAASRLADFLADHPRSEWRGEALLELMLSLTESGRSDSALSVGQSALEVGGLGSATDRVRYEIGRLLLDAGDWEAAERILARVAEAKDKSLAFEAALQRGSALEVGGRPEDAVALYERLEGRARADSQVAKAGLALAAVNVAAGRTSDALEKLAEIAELYPSTPQASQAEYRMGVIYVSRVGDLEKAEEHFSKAARARNVADAARSALESVKELKGFREALADTDSAALWLRAAECYLFELEMPESADVCYRRAASLGDSAVSPRASLALASLLERAGREREAKELLEDLLATYPTTTQAAEVRGMLRLASATGSDARPNDASVYDEGERALLHGDYESAIGFFEKMGGETTADEDAVAKALYALAWTLQEKLGRDREAQERYEQLVEQYPDSPYGRDAAFRLGLSVADSAEVGEVSPAEPKTTLVARCDTTGYGVLEGVHVRVRVLPDGRAAEVTIEGGSGSLTCDDEVRDVAQRARYVPAKKGGTPQEGWWEGVVEVLPLHAEQPPAIAVLEPAESGLDSVPAFTLYRSPDIPAGLLALAEGEEVILVLDLDESGSVTQTRIEEGPEAVRQVVLQTVAGWRFRPAYADGAAIASKVRITFAVGRSRR
jgi:TonB family protein